MEKKSYFYAKPSLFLKIQMNLIEIFELISKKYNKKINKNKIFTILLFLKKDQVKYNKYYNIVN